MAAAKAIISTRTRIIAFMLKVSGGGLSAFLHEQSGHDSPDSHFLGVGSTAFLSFICSAFYDSRVIILYGL